MTLLKDKKDQNMQESGTIDFNHLDLPQLVSSIRLLCFSSQKSQGSLLDFSLKVFALSSLPSYAALSYCWGNPFPSNHGADPALDWELPTHSAICNGKTIYLRRNLHEALQHLRKLESLPGYIWVDALCINQNDDNERSSQVSIMSEIYGRAEVVLGWLGPRNSSSETAYTFLKTFGAAVMRLIKTEGFKKAVTYSPRSHELFQKISQDPPPEASWHAWNELFQRTWFSRTWILQEASLAKKLVLMCGELEFEFEMLDNFNLYSHTAAWWPIRAPNYNGELLPEHAIVPITNTRRMVWESLESWANVRWIRGPYGAVPQATVLLRILSLSRGSFASNPLDKIYGNLGILKRIFGEDYVQTMTPDYTSEVEHLYTQVASYIVMSTPLLSLLTHVEDATNRKFTNMPSWVPDFNAKHEEGSALRFGIMLKTKGYGPLYNACLLKGANEFPTTRAIENNVLFVKGFPVGKMSEVSSLPLGLGANEFSSRISVVSRLPTTYVTGETLLETFLKTSLGDRTLCGKVSSDGITLTDSFVARLLWGTLRWPDSLSQEDYRQQVESHVRFLCSLEGSFSASMLSRLQIPALNSMLEDISKFASLCMDFQFVDELSNALLERSELFENNLLFPGRVLFRTDNEYLEQAPFSSQANDEVWLLEQSRVPFVLRPVTGTICHQLVGECYVHGVMQGELVAGAEFVTVRLK